MDTSKQKIKRKSNRRKLTSWKVQPIVHEKLQYGPHQISSCTKTVFQSQSKKIKQSFTDYFASHKIVVVTREHLKKGLLLGKKEEERTNNTSAAQKDEINTPLWKQSLPFGIDKELFKSLFLKPNVEISEASLAELIEEAEKGTASAQFQLGRCYQKGIGVPAMPKKAFYYYELAARQGHDGAQIELGIFYRNGIGVTQSPETAFHYFQLAADSGNRMAFLLLAECYEKGIGVKKNPESAFHWYQLSVDENDCIGLDDLGRCYKEGIGVQKSDEQACFYYNKYFTKLLSDADNGNAHKQALVGIFFQKGLYVEPSIEKAIEYYTLAEKQNEPTASILLGNCYLLGNGVPQSLERAKEFYKRAANLGDSDIQLMVGRIYLDMDEHSEAFHLFQLASQSSTNQNSCKDAYYMLAECFENGFGVEISPENALHYYKLSAAQGHEPAQHKLSFLLQGKEPRTKHGRKHT